MDIEARLDFAVNAALGYPILPNEADAAVLAEFKKQACMRLYNVSPIIRHYGYPVTAGANELDIAAARNALFGAKSDEYYWIGVLGYDLVPEPTMTIPTPGGGLDMTLAGQSGYNPGCGAGIARWLEAANQQIMLNTAMDQVLGETVLEPDTRSERVRAIVEQPGTLTLTLGFGYAGNASDGPCAMLPMHLVPLAADLVVEEILQAWIVGRSAVRLPGGAELDTGALETRLSDLQERNRERLAQLASQTALLA